MKTAIIIGGGPAGCQCALWLHMLGYTAVILEKNNQLGGLQCVSPYLNNWLIGVKDLNGLQIAGNIQSHIEAMNIPVMYNCTLNYAFIKEKNPNQCHVYARTPKARNSLWKKLNPSDIFLGEYHADQTLMNITYKNKQYDYDVFVVLYGWQANIPNVLESFKNILIDDYHFIYTDEMRRTKVENLYAIGEVTQRVHPCVVTSMADGVIAAKAIQFQLENNEKTP